MGASRRRLLLEAAWRLLRAGVAVRCLPFRRVARGLGAHMKETPETGLPDQTAAARDVAWAIRIAARNLPWESACLARAIAGKRMLRRRGIPSTLYLGAAKDEARNLKAHAWLRCGTEILTGHEERDAYTVVSFFS